MKILVTRHPALVEVLIEDFGLTFDQVLAHASPDDLADNDVTGVLPVHLAALCRSYTALQLNLPPEMRGVELSADQVRAHMGPLTTYVVMTQDRYEAACLAANGEV